ncbi:hypothetical protein [Ligilactobacillus cholophilus]|uniref:hypothetical protein n=1 Tax=Ligilactobacillus cholophilus TaxID=3050131 RepID=UPI0025B0E744|nr:hypothetical protein [Ligilactobacillus cholophilus]
MIAITIVLVAVIIGYIIGKHKEQKHYTLYTYWYYYTVNEVTVIREHINTLSKAQVIRNDINLKEYYVIKEYDEYLEFKGLKVIPANKIILEDKQECTIK